MPDDITNPEIPETPKLQEIEPDPHGPLTSLSYNLCSHGMMAGSGSSANRKIEWKKNGDIEYSYYASGSGKSFNRVYKAKPEIAQKIRDYVEEHKLAAIPKMNIETPAVFDCFTSATIAMSFDDSSIGGESYSSCTIQCGASGMTFKTIEDEIYNLLEECEQTGECIRNEMYETANPPVGMMGLGLCSVDNPVQVSTAGKTPAASSGEWKCKCGAVNTGKFCAECGSPRPAGWICSCGHENKGKFCENCGNPKAVSEEDGTWVCPACSTAGNRGNFCAGCGKAK